jgi:hypothetical protein
VHDLGEMCPYKHSENCADIHVQIQIKRKRGIKINFNRPYAWHNPHMLICKKIKIYIYYIIACLLLSMTVEENWKLQEKWDKVSIRNDHILPPFLTRLVTKMQNLHTALLCLLGWSEIGHNCIWRRFTADIFLWEQRFPQVILQSLTVMLRLVMLIISELSNSG